MRLAVYIVLAFAAALVDHAVLSAWWWTPDLSLALAAWAMVDGTEDGVVWRAMLAGLARDLVDPAGAGFNLLTFTALGIAFLRTGRNKAELEWERIGALLAIIHQTRGPMRTVVDRLGGRKFYRDVLQGSLPQTLVLVDQESDRASTYLVPAEGHAGHCIGFHVGGESVSPLTAIASCVAKYARELHMRLLNQHWCGRMPWLKPTAGYPQDAKRWLHQVGDGFTGAWTDDLVRQIVPSET